MMCLGIRNEETESETRAKLWHGTTGTKAIDMKSTYNAAEAFVTKDGSIIRELMHPSRHTVRAQSFAEATVEPGATTLLHLHRVTEEIYHVTDGQGVMTLGHERFAIERGDTIVIAPGTAHCVTNNGTVELKILCASTPAYSHEDTELLDSPLQN
jgi:mannose-6-phosphate isomerase-like protein (cupin superfamily)